MPDNDPIKHVVVLMLENRSFDHLLGGLSQAIPGLDGIDPTAPPRTNKDSDGKKYTQEGGAAAYLKYDPKHELEHVKHQLRKNNSGFVEDFAIAYPLSEKKDRAEIMKYFDDGALPAIHALAKNFAVCNKWFSSVPGPTWANRLFMHSGTSKGIVAMPEGIMDANLHWYDQTTIYDRLNEKNKSWRIYYGDIPQSLILVNQMEPHNAKNYFKLRQFYQDAAGKEEKFPQYCFIEPAYYQPGASDAHPPHDIREADKLVAEVYNALRRNDELWKTTLLVVLCDEHGGFYDHVVPPQGPPKGRNKQAVPPDHYVDEYSFDQLGVRVPAILVSPYIAKGVIDKIDKSDGTSEDAIFDHTSILKYVIDKWELGFLGDRVYRANSIESVIRTEQPPRADTPEYLHLPGVDPDQKKDHQSQYGQLGGRRQPALSEHQSALVGMTQILESITDVAENTLLGRVKRMITGLDGATDVAIERLEDFLDQQDRAHKNGARSAGSNSND